MDEGEFDARIYYHEMQEKRWDIRFGVVAAVYRNSKRGKESDPIVKPGDFFGYSSPEDEDDGEMTPEQTSQHLKGFFDAFNAKKAKAKAQSYVSDEPIVPVASTGRRARRG